MTVCIFNCSVALPPTEAYTFSNEMALWKYTILFSLYSVTKTTNYRAKIPLKGKKNSHLTCCSTPSFKLFHLVETRVYSC